MSRAVISGASSMIGRHLACELVANGYSVILLVRPGFESGLERASGFADEVRRGAEKLLQNDAAVSCGLGDVQAIECAMEDYARLSAASAKEWPSALSDGADAFFHLAWGGTFGAGRDDCAVQERNIRYSLDAVELASALGCKAFVGAGSQAEYGRVEGSLKPDTPAFPETGYGAAKLAAGRLTRLRCGQFGIKHCWTRILSVYGPYDGEQTMVSSTCVALLEGREPELTPCEQVWDYLYAEDAARALRLIFERGGDGEIYCVGSGQGRPLRECVEQIRDIVAPGAQLGFGKRDYARKQVMHLVADIASLSADTGFEPSVSFEKGILAFSNWLKSSGKVEQTR